MKTLTLIAALAALPLGAQDAPPMPKPSSYRYMLITDGERIYPKGTLASTAEVNAATNTAANLSAKITAQATAIDGLASRLGEHEATLADLTKDGVWVLEGYINSIGVLSGVPEYEGKIQVVHIEVPDNEDGTHHMKLWVAFDPAPVAASQVAMVGTTSLSDAFGDVTYTCSFPERVNNPLDPADSRAIYTFEADYDSPQGFAKIVSLPGASIGVGDYLPVTGGLSINGVNGATATVTADDGTVLTFKGGLLIDPVPVTSLGGEE